MGCSKGAGSFSNTSAHNSAQLQSRGTVPLNLPLLRQISGVYCLASPTYFLYLIYCTLYSVHGSHFATKVFYIRNLVKNICAAFETDIRPLHIPLLYISSFILEVVFIFQSILHMQLAQYDLIYSTLLFEIDCNCEATQAERQKKMTVTQLEDETESGFDNRKILKYISLMFICYFFRMHFVSFISYITYKFNIAFPILYIRIAMQFGSRHALFCIYIL